MRTWLLLLGGLIVWAVHFFLLYGIASVFPGRDIAYWLSIVATVPALAADGAILWVTALLRMRGRTDEFGAWAVDLGAGGAAISFVAVAWQVMPALIS